MENSELKFMHIFDSESRFLDLYDGKLLTNDGCMFKIHKIILARSSDYFLGMLYEISKNKAEFTIPNISGECLSDVLCYIYNGNICVTEENAVDLLKAANNLLLNDLYLEVKRNCRSNAMTDANCLKILKAANDIEDKEIYEVCFRFTQTRFEWIMCCEKNGVGDLPLEILETILGNRSLYVFSERTVWRAIVEWAQNDILHRLDSVPRLLLSLAEAEVEDELAEEILQHEIMTKNALLKDLNGEISSSDFTSCLQISLNLLRNRLFYISEPCYYRIPINIHIVWGNGKLHVTYDENIDLWNKIAEFHFRPEFARVIGHNIYTFDRVGDHYFDCKKFDLIAMDWVPMEACRWMFMYVNIVTIDQFIYVIGCPTNTTSESHDLVMYDTEMNKWFYESSLRDIFEPEATSIGKLIYVVGNDLDSRTVKMYMFDSVTKHWSSLSSPIVYRYYASPLIAYHQKIYLMGGTKEDEDIDTAEVYDPATNLWTELPDIPHSCPITHAMVFNNQIFSKGISQNIGKGNLKYYERKLFRWKFEKEHWEQPTKESHLEDFFSYTICTIDDCETIKIMTERNRDPRANLQKTGFKLNN